MLEVSELQIPPRSLPTWFCPCNNLVAFGANSLDLMNGAIQILQTEFQLQEVCLLLFFLGQLHTMHKCHVEEESLNPEQRAQHRLVLRAAFR